MSLSIATSSFAEYLPAVLESSLESYRKTYERNRHRVYSLSFLMTDNELAAEELMIQSFRRAFADHAEATDDDIDRALVAELRESMTLGDLTLQCKPCDRVLSVRRNTLRVDLERAVVQLPNTEKLAFLMRDVEGYDYSRIARLLGLDEEQSCQAVHQARLRLRELLAK